MNRERFIDKLKDLYYRDKNCLEELITAYDEKDKEIERLNEELEEKEAILGGIQQLEAEIERLNNIINELEKDFEKKIQSCTIEAETTTNDFYCRLHIATLKRWLNKIKELKGSDKE